MADHVLIVHRDGTLQCPEHCDESGEDHLQPATTCAIDTGGDCLRCQQ
jgi:hypothetical protein